MFSHLGDLLTESRNSLLWIRGNRGNRENRAEETLWRLAICQAAERPVIKATITGTLDGVLDDGDML
uniref:HDC08074 n=1 Tax=Drosophila melanogaster TaxID=7227 RepID=Q6ILY9_DROME|nr:TPA_inf: HDC08074 [Drosophila melanogaster]